MKIQRLTCPACDNHCQLEAEVDTEEDEVVDVQGNRCMKGYIYAQRAALEMVDEEHSI